MLNGAFFSKKVKLFIASKQFPQLEDFKPNAISATFKVKIPLFVFKTDAEWALIRVPTQFNINSGVASPKFGVGENTLTLSEQFLFETPLLNAQNDKICQKFWSHGPPVN